MKRLNLLIVILVSSLALFGCSQLSFFGGTTKVSRIEITPSETIPPVLAGSTIQFNAKAYDANNNEVSFVPASWPIYTTTYNSSAKLGFMKITGVSGNTAFAVFEGTGVGTGQVYCVLSNVWGIAHVSVEAGTVESITISPSKATTNLIKPPLEFSATARTIAGIDVYITPTWEVLGSVGTIEPGPAQSVYFTPSAYGIGTIEAYFGGVIGSAEVIVTSESP